MSMLPAISSQLAGARPVLAPAKERAGVLCRHAVRLAATHHAVAQREILAHVRSRRVTRARHVAMYLAHVVFGLSFTAVAAAFGRDRKTVVHAVRRIEDARDAPAFDAALANLETAASVLLVQERAAA